MKIDAHVARYLESLEGIEIAVDRGIATHQRSIGFHASSAAVDLLSIYLFQEKLVSPGTQVQHTWFKSRERADEKLPFTFPNKPRVLTLMITIEEQRDKFCYGTDQPLAKIHAVLDAFHELRDLFASMGVSPS